MAAADGIVKDFPITQNFTLETGVKRFCQGIIGTRSHRSQVTWLLYQDMIAAYAHPKKSEGKKLMERIIRTLLSRDYRKA